MKKLSMIDEEIAYEQAVENLHDLRSRLHQGARASRITLTANECYLLAHHVASPTRPRGHPTKDALGPFSVTMYLVRCEREGMTRKAAVDATMKQFSISRSSVYAAHKQMFPPSK